MYFYELHEGDDEFFSDVLLARETEMEADVFFDIVQTVRRHVQDSFDQDTLIEAIAEELEREYDFIFIGDDRLTAAVNVSTVEADNFIAELGPVEEDATEPEDGDDEDADAESGQSRRCRLPGAVRRSRRQPGPPHALTARPQATASATGPSTCRTPGPRWTPRRTHAPPRPARRGTAGATC